MLVCGSPQIYRMAFGMAVRPLGLHVACGIAPDLCCIRMAGGLALVLACCCNEAVSLIQAACSADGLCTPMRLVW